MSKLNSMGMTAEQVDCLSRSLYWVWQEIGNDLTSAGTLPTTPAERREVLLAGRLLENFVDKNWVNELNKTAHEAIRLFRAASPEPQLRFLRRELGAVKLPQPQGPLSAHVHHLP